MIGVVAQPARTIGAPEIVASARTGWWRRGRCAGRKMASGAGSMRGRAMITLKIVCWGIIAAGVIIAVQEAVGRLAELCARTEGDE